MTREEFEYTIKSCGCFIYRGQTYYEESELIKAFEDMGLIKQEPTDENLHREREQAYMQGYEDASKRFRQEPCEDAISRQALLDAFGFSEKTRKWGGDHSGYNTMMLYEIQDIIESQPSVKPQEKTGHWEWLTEDIYKCSECGEDIHVKEVMNVPQYEWCPMCGAKMD